MRTAQADLTSETNKSRERALDQPTEWGKYEGVDCRSAWG